MNKEYNSYTRQVREAYHKESKVETFLIIGIGSIIAVAIIVAVSVITHGH